MRAPRGRAGDARELQIQFCSGAAFHRAIVYSVPAERIFFFTAPTDRRLPVRCAGLVLRTAAGAGVARYGIGRGGGGGGGGGGDEQIGITGSFPMTRHYTYRACG